MKQRGTTRLAALLAALAVLALWFWGARQKDFYSRTLTEAAEQTCFTVHDMPAGHYTAELAFQAGPEGGRVQILDAVSHIELASADCAPGAGTVTLAFTLTEPLGALEASACTGDGALTLDSLRLTSTAPVYTDALWTLPLLALAAVGLLLCRGRYRQGSKAPLAVYLLSAAVSLPFLTDYLPYGMDVEYHLTRLYGMGLALCQGQFPVRINMDFLYGSGYINPIMYPELFLYPGGALCALGASALFAYKVTCVALTFVTGFTAYYAMRRMLGERAGLAFAALYLLCPYRLNDLFTRAALGEAWAMAFLPLAAVGIWQLVQGDYKQGFWSAMLGITGVLQSHVISVFLVVLFGVLYGGAVLLLDGRRFFLDLRRLGTLAAAAAATVLLNLWFLVPFLTYSGWDLNIFHVTGFLPQSTVYLFQAFMDSYTTTGETFTTAATGEMPLSIGFVLLVGVLLLLYRLICGRRAPRQNIAVGCLLLGSAGLFMASNLFPWAQVLQIPALSAVFDKLQFAWRLLMVPAVFYTAVTALVVDWLLEEKKVAWTAVLASLSLFTALHAASGYLSTNECQLATSSDEWRTNWIDGGQYFAAGVDGHAVGYQAQQSTVWTDSGAQITDYYRHGTTVRFHFAGGSGGELAFDVPLYYYELYAASLEDGTPLTLTRSERYHLLQVHVPAGTAEGTVTVRYREPLRFRLGNAVTLVTAAGLVLLYRTQRRKERTLHGDRA